MTHEEAINIVKTQYPHDSVIKEALVILIPELRESENERIRKWLIDYFSSIKKTVWIHRDITCEQILEWLEKQKEQKPNIEICPHSIKSKSYKENGYPIEPKPAWSEEDKKIIKSLILEVNKYVFFAGIEAKKIISFLKSLRPSWKPSEEQMKALIDCTIGNEYDVHALVRLWAELKKL